MRSTNRVTFPGSSIVESSRATSRAIIRSTYPFYIAPIIFPKVAWLGLPPVLVGMSQSVGHGVIFPRIAKARYSPAFSRRILLHVPIGLTYIRALRTRGPISQGTWFKSVVTTVVFAALGVAGPNFLGRDRQSPHAFTAKQLGAYDAANNEFR